MIKNQGDLVKLRKDWQSVRNKQSLIFRTMGLARGRIIGILDLSYSLVLIYAYAVLRDVLLQLRDEGYFNSPKKDNRLGTLMNKSKKTLTWVNFNEVDVGHSKRNDVAHSDCILPRGQSWKYIDAIEKELINWHIIPDQNIDYSIPWGCREQKTLNLS